MGKIPSPNPIWFTGYTAKIHLQNPRNCPNIPEQLSDFIGIRNLALCTYYDVRDQAQRCKAKEDPEKSRIAPQVFAR
jgi:hypothetical protein